MNARKWPVVLLISISFLLTGCANVQSNASQVTPTPSMSPGMSMAPGQSMPSTSSTAAKQPVASSVNSNSPSKATRMICGSETRTNVAALMGLTVSPTTQTHWANHIYTCTFKLTVGYLVISVKESSGVPKARIYFNALRVRLGHTKPITGIANLGFPAYESMTGTVVFLKDNKTLEVNASALPAHVGHEGSTRADFAYTVATDILACWKDK